MAIVGGMESWNQVAPHCQTDAHGLSFGLLDCRGSLDGSVVKNLPDT